LGIFVLKSQCKNELTPWRRRILEILIVTQLARKFPAFYGTRRFIAVFTTARHWSSFYLIADSKKLTGG
jgi:hypothetical protein